MAPALIGLLAARSRLWLSPSGQWPGASLLLCIQEGTSHAIVELSTICCSHGEAEQACGLSLSGKQCETYMLSR